MSESTPALCNARVGQGVVTYPCSLGLPTGHPGPCAAQEIRSSIAARQRWEAAQRHQASPLAQFQGFPQTTAERFTENPTPVPQSEAVLRSDAAEAQAAREMGQTIDIGPVEVGPYPTQANTSQVSTLEDGLEVLYRDEHIALKALPDGAYMVEDADGQQGLRIEPTTIDVVDRHEFEAVNMDEDMANLNRIEVHQGHDVVAVAPTKQREGDQRLPRVNDAPDCQSQMANDIMERRAVGIERYGTPLQPFNDRNGLQDAYEEALDLGVYLRRLLTMREASRQDLVKQAEEALREYPMLGPLLDVPQRMAESVVDRLLDAIITRQV